MLKQHAYLAAWGGETCKYNGVHVVNIADVKAPREVAFIQSKEGSYPGEGVQALPLSTAAFNGDILVTNNETCKTGVGFGGINIYDVTDPAHPTPLSVGFGDDVVPGEGKKDAHETHSVFAWDAGSRAYAAMVDNEEAADVDIVDITDPRKPVLIAEYDLAKTFPQILQKAPANLTEVFLHDMVVKKIGTKFVMLASYWDAGYVKLDVTNPRAATYLGDTDFKAIDPELLESSGLSEKPEGNAHQAEFTRDNKFVIAADEDFSPNASQGTTNDNATAFAVGQGSDTPQLQAGEALSGTAVFVGRACTGDPAIANAPSETGSFVAVVERGVCTFDEKVANVEAATGWDAIVIMNRTGSDGCGLFGMSVNGATPTFSVSREVGFGLFDKQYDNAACLAGDGSQLSGIPLGTQGDVINLRAFFDGWGYVHLYSNSNGKMTELDTYAIPEAHQQSKAEGFGDLSVHEVATSARKAGLAYLSYYAGGLRVIDVRSGEIQEKGAFIDQGGNNFWGVEVFTGTDGKEYVAASDRDLGLYIFEYKPANATP